MRLEGSEEATPHPLWRSLGEHPRVFMPIPTEHSPQLEEADRRMMLKTDDAGAAPRHRASIVTRVIRANKITSVQSTGVLLLALVGVAVAVVAIIMSRPIMTESQHAGATPGSVVMVSPSGKVVETGRAQLAVDLSSLAEADNFELYEHLTSFRVLDFDEKDLDEEIDRIENDIPPPPPSEHIRAYQADTDCIRRSLIYH